MKYRFAPSQDELRNFFWAVHDTVIGRDASRVQLFTLAFNKLAALGVSESVVREFSQAMFNGYLFSQGAITGAARKALGPVFDVICGHEPEVMREFEHSFFLPEGHPFREASKVTSERYWIAKRTFVAATLFIATEHPFSLCTETPATITTPTEEPIMEATATPVTIETVTYLTAPGIPRLDITKVSVSQVAQAISELESERARLVALQTKPMPVLERIAQLNESLVAIEKAFAPKAEATPS